MMPLAQVVVAERQPVVPAVSVAELPSISLDELVAEAPLMSRWDRKYLVPLAVVPPLLAGLADTARVLEIAGRRELGYRSVYFDTPGLASYHSTVYRRRRRFKIRTRSYLDTGLHVLELKTRGVRGLTTKQRIPYDGDGLGLLAHHRRDLAPALGAGYPSIDPYALEPVLSTHYVRTTLFLPGGGDRVTVDNALTWTRTAGVPHRLHDRAVVEVKSVHATSAADRLLWSLGHRPCSLSKYGTGLAVLQPGLPAHPWTSVVRRHIAPHLERDRP